MSEETKDKPLSQLEEARAAAALIAKHIRAKHIRVVSADGKPTRDDMCQYGTLRALIAIAEQLRVSNLIALANAPDGAGESIRTGCEALFNSEDTAFGRSDHGLKPDIAAILGLGDDHE